MRENRKRERESPPLNEPWIRVRDRKSRRSPRHPSLAARKTISPLSINTRPSDIDNLFLRFGKIHNIVIPVLQRPNIQYRFAFLRFMENPAVNLAIQAMDGVKLEGRILKIQLAKVDTYSSQPFP